MTASSTQPLHQTPSTSGTQARRVQLLNDETPIQLPAGITTADWTVEKIRWQNPRIRGLLGCIRLLGGVLESNYAILHCSPDRLLEIFRKVRQVSELVSSEISPLMVCPSSFPNLEEARQRAELSLEMLNKNVLQALDDFPTHSVTNGVTQVDLLGLRKLLCVSIGKLHAFLQDAFGEFVANDPRSTHDADYFLSQRFPQDLEEAEWLHSTVNGLSNYMETFDFRRGRLLAPIIADVRREQTLPIGQRWENLESFLDIVQEVLIPKLKEVLALRGIRFYEMEILDRYAMDIPTHCRLLKEIHSTGRRAARKMRETSRNSRSEREQSVEHLITCHAVFSDRLVELMIQIDKELRDLVAFVPIWLDSIEKRRALLLRREPSEGIAPGQALSQEDTNPILA
jgi:hypothetical protein